MLVLTASSGASAQEAEHPPGWYMDMEVLRGVTRPFPAETTVDGCQRLFQSIATSPRYHAVDLENECRALGGRVDWGTLRYDNGYCTRGPTLVGYPTSVVVPVQLECRIRHEPSAEEQRRADADAAAARGMESALAEHEAQMQRVQEQQQRADQQRIDAQTRAAEAAEAERARTTLAADERRALAAEAPGTHGPHSPTHVSIPAPDHTFSYERAFAGDTDAARAYRDAFRGHPSPQPDTPTEESTSSESSGETGSGSGGTYSPQADWERRAREREATAAEHVAMLAGIGATVMGAPGTDSEYRGASWRTRFSVGLGVGGAPVMLTRMVGVDGGRSVETRSTSSTPGAGLEVGVEVAPIESGPLQIYGYINGFAGAVFGSTNVGYSALLGFGGRIIAGHPWISAVGEIGAAARAGATSQDFYSSGAYYRAQGSGSGLVERYGLGLRFCGAVAHEHCNFGITLMLVAERAAVESAGGRGHWAMTLSLDLIGVGMIRAELAPGHAAMGGGTGVLEGASRDVYFLISIARTWDWFGNAYFGGPSDER